MPWTPVQRPHIPLRSPSRNAFLGVFWRRRRHRCRQPRITPLFDFVCFFYCGDMDVFKVFQTSSKNAFKVTLELMQWLVPLMHVSKCWSCQMVRDCSLHIVGRTCGYRIADCSSSLTCSECHRLHLQLWASVIRTCMQSLAKLFSSTGLLQLTDYGIVNCCFWCQEIHRWQLSLVVIETPTECIPLLRPVQNAFPAQKPSQNPRVMIMKFLARKLRMTIVISLHWPNMTVVICGFWSR